MSTERLTIREPLSADVPDLVRVHVDTWRSTYTQLLPDGFFTDDFIAGRERMWSAPGACAASGAHFSALRT